MNKKFHRKFLVFIFMTAIFSNPGLGFAQGTPDTTTIFFADFNTDEDSFIYGDDLFRGSPRVTTDLQVLYTFSEQGGSTVFDVSGVAPALDLTIGDLDSVSWQTGSLLLTSSTLLLSSVPANKLSSSISGSNALTIEAWVKPSNVTQTGPARIVTLSEDRDFRNFTLGQEADSYEVRLRTTTASTNGIPPIGTASGKATDSVTHVVYTRDASGLARIYINGVAVSDGTISGDLSNWDTSYLLGLGNEITGDRAWLGEFHLVAIYARALSGAEVGQNYSVGPDGSAPVITQHPENQSVTEGQSATFSVSASGFGALFYQWQQDSVDVVGAVDSSYTTGSLTLGDDGASFRCVVSNADGSTASNSATVTVNAIIDNTAPVIDSLTIGNPEPAFRRDDEVWYNQTNVDSVDFAVYYDEINVKTFTYNLGGLGGNQSPNVASGINRADTVRLKISGQSDGTYPLTVTITDSANNQASQSANIFLDSTAPTGTRASLDSVVLEDIYLSWRNGSDGTGSGLSGKFRVQVQTNGGTWQTLFSDTASASGIFNGQDGNTYGFEAASFDNIGNLEAFSNVADFSVEIDTTNDVNAPGPPIQLKAGGSISASPWQASPLFAISWQNPSDLSGIATAFYKLGSEPVSNSDYADTLTGVTSFNLPISQENGLNLYLWLSDNAGNVNFQNYSSVLLRYDATAPTGTRASSPETSFEEIFTVRWDGTGSDGSGSGLNGIYDVRVQVDGSSFTNWLIGFNGTENSFEGQQGHVYGFEVAAHDFAGNVEAFKGNAESATLVDTLGFDNVAPGPPLGMAANGRFPKSDWQNSDQFEVVWNPPSDPSGISSALYKLGDAPTANFDTTGSVQTGNSKIVTATEEDGQNFYLWFIDGRQNVDFNNYGVVQLRYDASGPTGTTAISPDTSSSLTFRVSWAGTGSDANGSGLSGFFNARIQENGGSWVGWLTNFSGTSQDYTGENGVEYGFEVVAIDNVGNVESFQNIAETSTIIDTVFADLTAPTVAHTPLTSVEQGVDVTIEAQVADNNQVDTVILFYRQNGVSSFQSVDMLPVSGNMYSATIPATQVSIFGLSYYIQASDGRNITFSPATNWDTMPYNISIRITGADAQGIVKSTTQPSGGDASSYRMISIPLNLEQGSAINVLQDDLGTYDPTVWRLFQYIAGTDTYVEYPDVIDFSPGKALWLIVKNDNIKLDSGVGASVPANEPFEITLFRGWNDIGNPFQFDVDVSNIEWNSGSVQGPYTYQGQWLLPTQVTRLSPWEGYSFFSEADNVTIAINPIAATTSPSVQKSNQTLDADWSIGIKAYSGELKDEYSQIGVAAAAIDNWDALDFLEPPFISDRVSVKFPHHDWSKFPGNFKTDFKPSAKEGWLWHFEAETSQKNRKIKLVFDNLESLPVAMNAVLIDRVALQKFDLNALLEYEFLPDQKTLFRQFELVIGTDDYISNSENILSLVPDQFYLSQNYPNPFNAGTKLVYHMAERSKVRIDIMNILGQTVTTLINEVREPGVYTLTWDGTGTNGLEVPSGMYFAKMRAGKFQKIRKMLYIR